MSTVIDKNQPAGLTRSTGSVLGMLASLLPGHLFAADNTGTARGLIRRTVRYNHNAAGTKLAKRVAKRTLGINQRGW